MTNLHITRKTPWTDADGASQMQIEVMLCNIESESATLIEYSVEKILSVDNPPPFYGAATGGILSKKFLKDCEGKVGMSLVSKA